MAENEKIEIPDDLLSEFSASFITEETENPGVTSAAIEKAAAWLLTTADNTAKEKGLPGLGKMKADDLAELVVIVARRNLGSKFLEQSPEIMLASVAAGIIGSNILAARAMKKETPEPENE